MYILAIDPGNEESAYAVLDQNLKPVMFAKKRNSEVLNDCNDIVAFSAVPITIVIEMVASYGMPVGREVFETCVWIGRFAQSLENMKTHFTSEDQKTKFIYRKEEKIDLCGSMKAKDSNIRQALIDRFGQVGTKKNPGWFYGVAKDVWSAIAVGVTYHDKLETEGRNG